MRQAFFILWVLAGLPVFSGPLALGQQQTGARPQTIEELRAAWRSLMIQRHGTSKDRLEAHIARREESLTRTISEYGLSPEQASRLREMSYRHDVERLRQMPISQSPTPNQRYCPLNLAYHVEKNATNLKLFEQHTLERLAMIPNSRYRAGLRALGLEGMRESHQKMHASWVMEMDRLVANPCTTNPEVTRRLHEEMIRYHERMLKLIDELIAHTHSIGDQSDEALFRSPNVVATGRVSDEKLQWRLRNELDRIQQRYDLIASQLEASRYDQARRNIELLRQALPAAGELVAQVQAGGDACEVVLIGLPTDAAMARIAELERMRAENLRHYRRVQAELTRINDDLFRASTEYINEVWRAMTQNLVEWHSPPDWYGVPKTFKGWHDQSKEQAGKILSRQEVIQNLRLLEKHLREEMRDVLDRHREEIVEKLDSLEPVAELALLVQNVVSQIDWAHWTPRERGD